MPDAFEHRKLRLPLLVAMSAAFMAVTAWGVVPIDRKGIPVTRDLGTFRSSLSLPFSDTPEHISPPTATLKRRAMAASQIRTIESLTVQVPLGGHERAAWIQRLAASGKTARLDRWLRAQMNRPAIPNPDNGENAPLAGHRLVTIDASGFSLFNPKALASIYTKTHHRLSIRPSDLNPQSKRTVALLEQLVPFFSAAELRNIRAKLTLGQPISVDRDLLPKFARDTVKRFLTFRGPNCFHAALAFQGNNLSRSPLINVKEEDGYHRAMINYDELWRALNLEFYEVNPARTPLKYGDVLVFLDAPRTSTTAPTNFRWIRHTATYLFNGYTFSKGSKSPNTPYTIKTLEEEWKTWSRYTGNLGVRVYRRASDTLPARPPKDMNEWLY